MIHYSTDSTLTPDAFIDLLKRSTLAERRPIADAACIAGMLTNSNLLVSAWDGGVLVGAARSVTDFHYACYLSDLAVAQSHQRQGIGKALIEHTQAKLRTGCKLILIAAPAADTYYEPLGFERNLRCWVK